MIRRSKKRRPQDVNKAEEDALVPKKQKKRSSAVEPQPSGPAAEQRDGTARTEGAALEVLTSGFGESWREELSEEFGKPYFKQLMTSVCEERTRYTVYPPAEDVFRWTQTCDIRDVKVVILGQDPYHGPDQAHGLCFSVRRPVRPPPSLENMFKELASDIEGFRHPGHGDLTGWSKQGVLLLNAVLTVRAQQANSHKGNGWESFTDAVVTWLSTNLEGLVFMLWGAYAQKKGASIDRLCVMAMFGKVLEPVGYMQTVRVLVQDICSYLGHSATAEESESAKKNLDHIDQELGASGHGLLDDQEVHRLEDDLAVVYYQLGTAVRAQPDFTKRETEVFLQYVQDYRLERQLTALYSRLMGVSALTDQPTLLEELILSRKPKRWEMREFCVKINFVLGTGLLCLFTQASLTGRDQALLMKTWSDRMGALYRKMKNSGGRCLGYFLEQAEGDVRQQLQEAVQNRSPPEDAAASILKTLEKNYDWLRWAVMLHPAVGPMEDEKDEKDEEETEVEKEPAAAGGPPEHQLDNLISVASEAPIPHVVVCYRDTPTSLDKSRIHQLIVDLEWKIPNPPPEVYASIEEDPGRARRYLASRMLRKLQDGLGSGVAVHVVPGRMEMKCNFPPASYYLYEYKHRLASGTVCVFG